MIIMFYTCKGCCADDERAVKVPARGSAEENVMVWMELIMKYVKADHVKNSPNCEYPNATLRFPLALERDYLGQEEH